MVYSSQKGRQLVDNVPTYSLSDMITNSQADTPFLSRNTEIKS